MARRLYLVLTPEQIRAIHDAALERARDAEDGPLKQRWEAVIRETAKALDFHKRTRPDSSKVG